MWRSQEGGFFSCFQKQSRSKSFGIRLAHSDGGGGKNEKEKDSRKTVLLLEMSERASGFDLGLGLSLY